MKFGFWQTVYPRGNFPPKYCPWPCCSSNSKEEKKQARDKKRQRGFEMRIGLQQRWEVVTGLCGDSHPVKPTNVEVMPPAGCSKTVIMKNTGEDNIKWLLYILQWRLDDTKVGWQRHRRQRQALVLLIESLVKSSILAAWKVTVTDILLQTHTHTHIVCIASESVFYRYCMLCALRGRSLNSEFILEVYSFPLELLSSVLSSVSPNICITLSPA